MIDLERIDGAQANLPMLGWQLQPGFADQTCSSLDPMLGQRTTIIVRGQSVTCLQTQHRTCRLGDLTTKCDHYNLSTIT